MLQQNKSEAAPAEPSPSQEKTPEHEQLWRTAAVAYLQSITAEPNDYELIIPYLENLRRERLKVALAQLDTWQAVADDATRLELPSIYTELRVSYQERDDRELYSGGIGTGSEGEQEEKQDITATAFASRFHRAVILGKPGSGKSTFTNMLAYALAGSALCMEEGQIDDLLPTWYEPPGNVTAPPTTQLPLYIVLREYAGSGLSLWDYLSEQIDSELNPGTAKAIENLIFKEGGILFLDGLDEVPDAKDARDGILTAVQGFAKRFPKVRLVVTSRPYAYEENDWRLEGDFTTTKLKPFDEGQRREFTTKWFAHAAPKKGLSTSEAETRRDKLIQQIESLRHIRELADVPLMLTMICLLDLGKGGGVPENRQELYSNCVDLLLEIWQKPKQDGQSLQQFIGVTKDELLRVIEKVAYDFHCKQGDNPGVADIDEASLIHALYGLAKSSNSEAKSDDLLAYLRDRAGLLNDHGELYRFPHRTFQEYLAGRFLSDQDANTIFDKVTEDAKVKWREPFLLACAKLRKGSEAALFELFQNLRIRSHEQHGCGTVHWRIIGLMVELVDELNLTNICVGNATRESILKDLLNDAAALIEAKDNALTNEERYTVAMALGRIGDTRPGVGCVEGVPDIEWVPVDGESFAIAKHLVTRQQYRAFVESAEYQNASWWRGHDIDPDWAEKGWSKDYWSIGSLPMADVSWFQAHAFCLWLGERLALPIQLPTETQWMRTAAGECGDTYPWGSDDNDIDQRCNIRGSLDSRVAPVGMFQRGNRIYSEKEVCDLAGNLWEWSADWSDSDKDAKALRGGAFFPDTRTARASARDWYLPDFRNFNIGFRVLSSPFETNT